MILFYWTLQDWWNSTSFANYYRTWNVVVHDWLYYYVYRDLLWVSFALGHFHTQVLLNWNISRCLIFMKFIINDYCCNKLKSVK